MVDTQQLYKYYLQHPSVQTDTRKLRDGDLFFALKGPHFNGNAFAQQALEKGAAYAVIDEEQYKTDERMILVPDALSALQQLAHYHRNQFNIPFIAITGSNGKTTTKELVHAVLSEKYLTYSTEGNLNNHIGIPLTLLRIKANVEMAVIEMGANHQKEIESYCEIVNPTHGLITNIGKAHLEGFGGLEGVRKGKGELFDYLRKTGGAAFACKDFDYFEEMTKGLNEVVWYGTKKDEYLNGQMTGNTTEGIKVKTDYTGEIPTHITGDYNLYNILAATAIGQYFKVPADGVKNAISSYIPQNARSQVIGKGSNTIILDAYNANPTSMKAAIENFAALKADQKILMLGAMMELGKDSIAEHQQLIDLIRKWNWKHVVLVGGDFSQVDHPYIYFSDAVSAKGWFDQQHFQEAAILIKGSRRVGMEKILE